MGIDELEWYYERLADVRTDEARKLERANKRK